MKIELAPAIVVEYDFEIEQSGAPLDLNQVFQSPVIDSNGTIHRFRGVAMIEGAESTRAGHRYFLKIHPAIS